MSRRDRDRRERAGSDGDEPPSDGRGSNPPARPRIRRRPGSDAPASPRPSSPASPHPASPASAAPERSEPLALPAKDAHDDPTTRRVALDRAERAHLAELHALAERTFDDASPVAAPDDDEPPPSSEALELDDADLVEATQTGRRAAFALAGLADVDPETTIQDSSRAEAATAAGPWHEAGPKTPGSDGARRALDAKATRRVDLARTAPHAATPELLAEVARGRAGVANPDDDATAEGDPRVLDALAAFERAPADAAVVGALEDAFGGRHDRLVRAVRRLLARTTGAARIPVLAHLVRWTETPRPELALTFVAELEHLDPGHPAVLRRAARARGDEGDVRGQREALEGALARASRPDDRARLHLELAAGLGDDADALAHFAAAAEEDPRSVAALTGLERVARLRDDHPRARAALERLVDLAPDDDAKVAALVRLAEVEEQRFVRRERAAQLLEQARAIAPTNAQVLRALERAYQGLRDFPHVVEVLTARAELAKDHAARAELMLQLADVHETKLDDPAAAVDALRDAAFVQPKHRRVLEELGRLHERLGNWSDVAEWRTRAAELAPSKRHVAQALLELGDALALPERSPALAKAAYEHATRHDPSFVPAWTALQRGARAVGDARLVVHALEQRAKHAEGGRARGDALAELGALHRDAGDAGAARKSFEAALRADAKNERAAQALVDTYVEEGRLADAAPLAELLVAAAVRDKSGKVALARQRLLTRLYASLGQGERAIGSALVALDRSADDAGAQGDVVAVSLQLADRPQVVRPAKPTLDRLTTAATQLEASDLADLARVLRALGDLDGARRALERAKALYGERDDVMGLLAEVQLGQGDVEAAFDAKLTLAETSENPAVSLATLVEAGELAERRLRDRTRARAVFEGVLERDPSEPRAQDALRRIYAELEEHERLARVLELTAATTDDVARKVDALEALAQLLEGPLGAPAKAAEAWREVLDADPTRLVAFEGQTRALTATRDWKALARAYDGMIARARSADDKRLQHVLHLQSALVRRDRLRDLLGAERDVDAALALEPDAADPNRMRLELLVLTDRLDRAVEHLRARIAKRPHDATGYADLYDVFLRKHAYDRAWCAVNVLACLGAATPEQRRFHDDYRPVPLREIPGRLTEAAWTSHLLHPGLDHATTRLLMVMTPLVARTRAALGAVPPAEAFHAGHAKLAKALLSATHDVSEILGVRSPTLALGDPASALPLQPAPTSLDVLRVGVPALELHADCLGFTVARRLAELRSELVARAFFPTLPELTAVVATALRVAGAEAVLVGAGGPRLALPDPAAQAFDTTFLRVASWEERDAVAKLATVVAEQGAALDVAAWARAAEISSARAGLLVAGDLEAARRAIAREPRTAGDPTPTDKLGELFQFAVGERYAELRAAIGITIDARQA